MRDILRKFIKLATATIIAVSFFSCIDEENENCGMCLEFVYDWNMDFSDSFKTDVEVVDLYLFDANNKFIRRMHIKREELKNGNRLIFGEDLSLGTYKLLTVGGLSDEFHLTDGYGNDLLPHTTTLNEVRIKLRRYSEDVSREFPHLWVGKEPADIIHTGSRTPQRIYLLKYTNRFNLSLRRADGGSDTGTNNPYTLEIATPEGAVYGHDNSPLRKEKLTYKPHYIEGGNTPDELLKAKISTVRLFHEEDYHYRLIVRNSLNGKILWDYDLMALLEKTNPGWRPDGEPLSLQEYLDRQSEWDIAILYGGDIVDEYDSFVAVGVNINGWIIWFHGIEV